jgi:hypothetical protein
VQIPRSIRQDLIPNHVDDLASTIRIRKAELRGLDHRPDESRRRSGRAARSERRETGRFGLRCRATRKIRSLPSLGDGGREVRRRPSGHSGLLLELAALNRPLHVGSRSLSRRRRQLRLERRTKRRHHMSRGSPRRDGIHPLRLNRRHRRPNVRRQRLERIRSTGRGSLGSHAQFYQVEPASGSDWIAAGGGGDWIPAFAGMTLARDRNVPAKSKAGSKA